MKQLSGLDATFLYLETPETPMHVGALHLYELPKEYKGSFRQAVINHIGKRAHLAPILTRVLAFMPFDLGHPAWVASSNFDLRFHIREVPAKKAGAAFSVKEVQAIAAKLHSQLIDRNHPLWEFHVFENIKPPPGMKIEGRLVGFHSKIHHAALDGKGGTVLANAMLDLTPVPREVPPPDPSKTRKTASDLKIGEMIGAVFSNSLAASSRHTNWQRRRPYGGQYGQAGSRPRVGWHSIATRAQDHVQHGHHTRSCFCHRHPALCTLPHHG
jgi:diacylglycerol O-acyltransferase / wax synthase